jgi:S1-C subfamily serine protease
MRLLPLEISSEDIEVGADVRAIGHPKGEEWTYTKGIVSSVRPDYEWSGEPGESHRATVIQTQTPINPGNSGGPLLSDEGKIVGVNSFRKKEPKP